MHINRALAPEGVFPLRERLSRRENMKIAQSRGTHGQVFVHGVEGRGPHGQVFVHGVESRGPHGQVFVHGVESETQGQHPIAIRTVL